MALKHLPPQIVGGIQYFIHPQVLGSVASRNLSTSQPIPAVVLSPGADVQHLPRIFDHFSASDDVFSNAFTSTIITQFSEPRQDIQASRKFSQETMQADGGFHQLVSTGQDSILSPGPYFLVDGDVHQAWRLYEDELDSFMTSIYPEDCKHPQRYKILDALSPSGLWRVIAVPSRLYAVRSASKPLAGKRISVKDIYDIAGIKTTVSSRDWASLYGLAEKTAEYVSHLVSLGAVIVGKSKTTAFAGPDEPTDLWVDFHCPVNPRGDRYQSPSGSTTGGAAALAGYEWLDVSVGSDSGGSIRAPATANGLFSLRPTYGAASTQGNVINLPGADTIGLLDRSLDSLYQMVSNTMELEDSTKYPRKIIYPLDFFPHSNANQQAMVEEFVSLLEKFLGVKRTVVDIASTWQENPPKGADGKPLKEFLRKSLFWPRSRDYYNLLQQFRADFKQATGREAYLGSIVSYRYGIGKDVTERDAETFLEEQRVFREWFDVNIMSKSEGLLSSAIMVMPYGSGNPKYRDTPNGPGSPSNGFGEQNLSIVLKAPQLVIPIGQNAYQSRISGRQEFRPIATTVMGARGSDLMLINLVRDAFKAHNWPLEVLTGRFTFEVGNNTRNVASTRPESTVGRMFESAISFCNHAGMARKEL